MPTRIDTGATPLMQPNPAASHHGSRERLRAIQGQVCFSSYGADACGLGRRKDGPGQAPSQGERHPHDAATPSPHMPTRRHAMHAHGPTRSHVAFRFSRPARDAHERREQPQASLQSITIAGEIVSASDPTHTMRFATASPHPCPSLIGANALPQVPQR